MNKHTYADSTLKSWTKDELRNRARSRRQMEQEG